MCGILFTNNSLLVVLEPFKIWLNSINLSQRTFKDGETPKDKINSECYIFNINNEELVISYVIDEISLYILYNNTWYEIMNQSNMPISVPYSNVINK